jgi:hypothetical protein
MKLHMVLLGMLLLLVLPALHADPQVTAGASQVQDQLWVRPSGNSIDVSLIEYQPGVPMAAITDTQARNKAMIDTCNQGPNPTKCIEDQSKLLTQQAAYPVAFDSVQDANITFLFWNQYRQGGAGWQTVPGCEVKKTDSVSMMWAYNSTTQSYAQVPLYSTTCQVDTTLYSGRTMEIKILVLPSGEPTGSAMLSDANTSIAAMFSSALANAFVPVRNSMFANTVPCTGVFLILGLLLASMYFSGKSPITLLDITTPRLPSPKGFAAGGQIIGPFGYTDMKNAVSRKLAAAGTTLAAEEALLRRGQGAFAAGGGRGTGLSSAHGALIDDLKKKMKASGAEAAQIASFGAIAATTLSHGGSVSEVKQIAKRFGAFTEKDNAVYKQMLNRVERLGGRYAIISKQAAEVHQAQSLLESLGTLTYKGGSVTGKIQKGLVKLYGIDRYKALGFVPATFDSAARSTALLWKSTKAAGTFGAQFARESGKFAVETIGGKTAMKELQERAKTSPGARMVYDQLNMKAKEIKIGTVMRIDQKMEHLGNALLAEVQRDQMRYLLKEIYSQMGVKVAAMSDRKVAAMANEVVDPVAICMKRVDGRLPEIEGRIRAILSDSGLSVVEKRSRLEGLLTSIAGAGYTMDSAYMKMKSEIDRISQEKVEGHVKLVMIQETLDRENKAMAAAKAGEERIDGKYYSMVGRGPLHGSDLFEVAVLRRAIYDNENGYTVKGTSIRDFLNAVRLDLENKIMTLNPLSRPDLLPEYMRDRTVLAKKAEDNRKVLASLLTDEGERALMELKGKNRNNATLDDFMSVLYGNEWLNHAQGLKATPGGVHLDPKTGKTMFWEEDQAIGPQAGWWKTDMKRQWKAGIDTRELSLAIGTFTEARFTRGYTAAQSASVEAEMDRYAGSKTWSPDKRQSEAKKLWVRNELEKDMLNNFNDRFAMNAYGGATNETMRYYANAAAALLGKALRDAGFEERHTDVRFLESMDVNNPKDMERLRYMLGTRYKKEFEGVMSKPITFDDIARSQNAWIMTHEGSYVPYRPGMMVSDNDRILGGHVAMKDGNIWRRYNPDDVKVDFQGREGLGLQFNKLASNNNKKEWEPFIKDVVAWAREGGDNYERQRVLGAVLWRYGNVTYDYGAYWNETKVRLVPRHEATPLAPNLLRFFGVEAPGLTKTLKPVRDFGQLMGHYMVRTALAGSDEWLMRSYDVTPRSQMLKMHSWRLANQILTSDWNDLLKDVTSEHDRRQLASSYRAYALSHGAYHQVWAFTIDRNPWRTSTSYGAHQAWASAFQMGPAETYSMRSNLRSYMDKGEYSSFMALYGWPMALARKAIMPYQKMIAGSQRALQGYASKWEGTENPLMSYGNYTSPRLLEAFRNYNPMSFSHGRGWINSKIQTLNKYESRAEKAQLVGYDHAKGLMQGYSDISVIYKGAAAIARTGMANPAASITDTRFNEQLAAPMAEYLMMRNGPMSGFYKEDPYVRDRAMTDTIRRTVSAEALAIKRQQELMGFGISQNPLYSWFNPVLFAYHMGIPGYPTALSPKELINSAVNTYRRGGAGNLAQSVKSSVRNMGDALNRAFHPGKASMTKYCRCGKPGFSPGTCGSCGSPI